MAHSYGVNTLLLPPQSIESEQAVLGAIMIDNRLLDDLAGLLVADDFYRREHRTLYLLIVEMAKAKLPIDFVTVCARANEHQLLEQCGGQSYIGSLLNELSSLINFHRYAEIVREKSILRSLIQVASDTQKAALQPGARQIDEILENAERSIFDIRRRRVGNQDPVKSVGEYLPAFHQNLEDLVANGGKLPGLSTGFSGLDVMTKGLHAGDLLIIAGRPGMGKTSFAMNIAEHVALHQKVPVAFFSMEMPANQLVLRLISSVGRIDQSRLRGGDLGDREWDCLVRATDLLQGAPLYIDETPALNPGELRSRIRNLARKCSLGLVVIDYLQLMQIPMTRENRTNEIGEISRGLKSLAKEFRVPVIALSQLNRALENRDNKRPKMSDLRDSGGIEQDADVILFVHRESYYNKLQKEDRALSEIIIAKHRNGPTGEVMTFFTDRFTRFDDIESLNLVGEN